MGSILDRIHTKNIELDKKDEKLQGAIRWYLEYDVVTEYLKTYLLRTGKTLRDIGTPTTDKRRKDTGDIAEALGILDSSTFERLAEIAERGVGVWKIVGRHTHIIALRWDGVAKNKQSIGKMFVAFGTGGSVGDNSFPVYSWDGVAYRAYEYLLLEATIPGRTVYRKYKNGTKEKKVSWSNLVSDISRG